MEIKMWARILRQVVMMESFCVHLFISAPNQLGGRGINTAESFFYSIESAIFTVHRLPRSGSCFLSFPSLGSLRKVFLVRKCPPSRW